MVYPRVPAPVSNTRRTTSLHTAHSLGTALEHESTLHYAHGAVDQDHARLALDTGNHLSWSLSDDFVHCACPRESQIYLFGMTTASSPWRSESIRRPLLWFCEK